MHTLILQENRDPVNMTTNYQVITRQQPQKFHMVHDFTTSFYEQDSGSLRDANFGLPRRTDFVDTSRMRALCVVRPSM